MKYENVVITLTDASRQGRTDNVAEIAENKKMVMERVKQTREEREGEKEENMTRLQQLALSQGCP